MALKLLAIAVASGRIGYVYLIGDKLMDWGISDRAAKSAGSAAAQAQRWINDLGPDVVVTEKVPKTAKKGQKTRALIEAITNLAAHNYVLDVSVVRTQVYVNKYAEAKALTTLYPELSPWLKIRKRFYDNEPRSTVVFEALALALIILRGPTPALAAALG